MLRRWGGATLGVSIATFLVVGVAVDWRTARDVSWRVSIALLGGLSWANFMMERRRLAARAMTTSPLPAVPVPLDPSRPKRAVLPLGPFEQATVADPIVFVVGPETQRERTARAILRALFVMALVGFPLNLVLQGATEGWSAALDNLYLLPLLTAGPALMLTLFSGAAVSPTPRALQAQTSSAEPVPVATSTADTKAAEVR